MNEHKSKEKIIERVGEDLTTVIISPGETVMKQSESKSSKSSFNNEKSRKEMEESQISINNEIHRAKTLFQVDQIKCKQDFDTKTNNFDLSVQTTQKIDNDDSLDNFTPLLDGSSSLIERIEHFKVCSKTGNLKHKLNLELIFFTKLKSLRLRYINQVDYLNKKLIELHKNEYSGQNNNVIKTKHQRTEEEILDETESALLLSKMSSPEHILPVKSNKKKAVEFKTDTDLFSSLISSIELTESEDNVEKRLKRTQQPKKQKSPILCNKINSPKLKDMPNSCQKCKNNHKRTRSISDIFYKVNYFFTRYA